MKNKSLKKKITIFFKIIFFLSIGLLFIWLFLKDLTPEQKNEIIISIKSADYRWLILAIIFGFSSHVFRTLRWMIMMEPLGYKPKFLNVFFSVFIGYFANLALPRLGEFSRCGVLTKYEKIPFQKSFGTVITERALDMLVFMILFIVNFALQFKRLNVYVHDKIYLKLSDKFLSIFNPQLIWAGLILIILVLAFIIYRNKSKNTKLYEKIKLFVVGLWDGIKSLTKIKKTGLFIFYTLMIWALYLLMTIICFYCLPETADLGINAGFAVLIFGSIGIIVVQGGIGVYPAIVAETLYLYSITSTTAYALGWILWLNQTIMIIFAGIISLILVSIYNKKK